MLFISDVHKSVYLFRYLLSSDGTGFQAWSGSLIGFILGIVFVPLKTLLDGLAWLYQDLILIKLRKLSKDIGAFTSLPEFDLNKNHFIGHWFMPLQSIGQAIALLISLILCFPIFIAEKILRPRGAMPVFSEKLMSWLNKFFAEPFGCLFAGILSFSITLLLYLPHKLLDNLCSLWKSISDKFDEEAATCFVCQVSKSLPYYENLLPKKFNERVQKKSAPLLFIEASPNASTELWKNSLSPLIEPFEPCQNRLRKAYMGICNIDKRNPSFFDGTLIKTLEVPAAMLELIQNFMFDDNTLELTIKTSKETLSLRKYVQSCYDDWAANQYKIGVSIFGESNYLLAEAWLLKHKYNKEYDDKLKRYKYIRELKQLKKKMTQNPEVAKRLNSRMFDILEIETYGWRQDNRTDNPSKENILFMLKEELALIDDQRERTLMIEVA